MKGKKIMGILCYTTKVAASKTVAEIESILVKHKAQSIMKNYKDEKIVSLSFLVNTGCRQIPIKLPAKIEECYKVLKKERKSNKAVKDTMDQAEMVAWRILKNWIDAQMALLDIEMVQFEEVFMPYIVDTTGKTLFEKLEKKHFLIEG